MHILDVNGVKLLQVKNPWGEFEIPSEYSDHSSKWTPEFKKHAEKQLGRQIDFLDDGLFFIE